MSLSKVVLIVAHLAVALVLALFAGWAAISIDLSLGSFNFWVGAFMGVLSYSIFIVSMVILMGRWGEDE